MKITGKVAIVTGGAAGIGKGLCSRLLENGAKFVAILDFDLTNGQKTASEFSSKYGEERVKFYQCDVTDETKLKNAFQEAYDVYGALDIVANNAGIISNDVRKTIEVNLVAVINGIFIAEKLMTKNQRTEKGIIINTASMAGLIRQRYSCLVIELGEGPPSFSAFEKVAKDWEIDSPPTLGGVFSMAVPVAGVGSIRDAWCTTASYRELVEKIFKATNLTNCSYNATKHGVVGLTRCFKVSRDGFSKDVRCNAVCPALVMTGLYTSSGDYMTQELGEKIEANRNREISVDLVVDAYMQIIEDDDLNGALLKITTAGIEVDKGS